MIFESIDEIIKAYDIFIKIVDKTASEHEKRAYGGFVRASKGTLVENIAESLIKIAWLELKQDISRLSINKKKIEIPIRNSYIRKIKDKEIREYIEQNKKDYHFKCSVDKHVYIDDNFVLAIECKAYAENAMIKRILVDFGLLKTQCKNIKCILLQLESQLGGDYSDIYSKNYGSKSTHTLMSYFSKVDLLILTMLQGERKVDKPIHKKPYHKELTRERLNEIKDIFKRELSFFI